MKSLFATVVVLVCTVTVGAIPLDVFYPYDVPAINQQLMANDDAAASRAITLSPPLIYYGRSYNTCKVQNNGVLALNKPPERFMEEPLPLPNYTFIAPFYGDVDTRRAGTVWFTDPASRDPTTLNRTKDDIQAAFEDHVDFEPSYVVIATWDHVGYFNEQYDKLNTFQCIITSDGHISFAIFLYNETQWTTTDGPESTAKIGFNEGTLMMSWEVPCSMTPELGEISKTSNIGVPGKWIFRLDKGAFSACPKDKRPICESDPFCSCLTSNPKDTCQCSNNEKYTEDCSYEPEITTKGSDVISYSNASKLLTAVPVVLGVLAMLLFI